MAKISGWQKRQRFIELRGRGVTFKEIAAEIGSSRSTIIRWSRELAVEVKNFRSMELETLRKEYLVTREHRVKVLATQLNNIAQALIDQDLSGIPANRLMEMQTHIGKELHGQCPDMELCRDMPRGCEEHIQMELTKRHAWEV